MTDNEVRVSLTDGVETVMEERGIRLEDLEKVVAAAESTNVKLKNKVSGHFLAKSRLDKVTVYAEYSLENETAVIYDTYSHRVTLKEDT